MSKVQRNVTAKFIRTMYAAKGAVETAAHYAMAQNWAEASLIAADCKSIATAMSTADYAVTATAADFSAAVRARTVVGRLTAARKVPPLVRILNNQGKSSAAFVGQGQPIRVSKLELTGGVLAELKVSGIGVFGNELLESSSPAADSILSDDLAAACAEAMDKAFLDPANAGVANERPAAVTHGAPSFASTGATFAQIDADLTNMMQMVVSAGSDMLNSVWILRPETAIALSTLRDPNGGLAYPQVTVLGGILKGLPVIVSANLPEPGSPALAHIVLLDQSQVAIVDEGAAQVEVFRQGSLEMLDNPTNNSVTGAAANMVSLFQVSCAAFRGTLWTNWQLRRPFIALLTGVSY
ncbi:phage major capsid protein [Pseudoduganella sp. UC29_106]|uniref:phage major capsid protein n=1 Tax=Pseudoduganella sp. UC29_106 TaxID=3374553 RepID=UPI003756B047